MPNRTNHSIRFADPYKVCEKCGGWVDGVIRTPDGPDLTIPCEHDRSYRSVCPSWGPVDGCQCQKHLGHVPHASRPDRGN